MRYFENTSLDPYFNQAFEEYVFEQMSTDVLLLWRNDPAVVCGRFQNLYAEVDVWQAHQEGIALIRRISGGGTVYHDPGNINYTLIGDAHPEEASFPRFLDPLIKVLAKLGIPAHRIPGNGLAIAGEKISGSAQRSVKGRVMHHGTLLFDTDLGKLHQLANGRRDAFSGKGTQSVPWPVTNIRGHLADPGITVEVFLEKLLEGFAGIFDLVPANLTEADLQAVERLAQEKYRSFAWTWGKSPAFSCQRDISTKEGMVHLDYTAQDGVVTSIRTTPQKQTLESLLLGRRLDPLEISQLLERAGLSEWTAHLL